jgi:signal transduction histidine kinase
MLYSGGKRKFYILISAQDLYESRSLHYLRYVLLAAFLAGMALVWGLSFFLSRASLLPLDTIRRQFSEISGRSLTKRLPVSGRHDEIDGLVASFNLMMDRIDMAYRAQKQFTADASHELRAPLSRLTAKMENLIRRGYDPSSEREPVQAMLKDTHRLSDMLSALLQLTELDDTRTIEFASLRIDDVIFDAAANFSRLHEGFQFNVDIQVENEQQLLIHGNESLLKIALTNIFKNAYLYSLNQAISCRICTERDHPVISFTNNGKSPEIGELALLFNTFYRGNNAKGKAGSGLGLSIVQRIVERHSGLITFRVPGDNVNVLTLAFLIP